MTNDDDLALRAAQLCKGEIKLEQFIALVTDVERVRIRAEFLKPCAMVFVTKGHTDRCRLPKGHIGGHYGTAPGVPITVSSLRINEILNG